MKQVPRVGKIAAGFVKAIPKFVEFMNEIHMQDKLNGEPVQKASNTGETLVTTHELSGKSIVFTGGKDKALIKTLGELGAIIGSAVSKNTYVLIAKDKNADTGKVKVAKDKGVNVMTVEEFKEAYNI